MCDKFAKAFVLCKGNQMFMNSPEKKIGISSKNLTR